MNNIYDVIIIGGGASGLMCANFLDKSLKVAIIDKQEVGKKILATGNGRCNFTNSNIDYSKYNTIDAKNIVKEFDSCCVIDFFKHKGVESYADGEGRVYPLSDTAKDIKIALTNEINSEVVCDEVIKVLKNDLFELHLASGKRMFASQVVMACSNKQITNILSDFELKFEKTNPVLSGFICEGFDKRLFGVREDCEVKARVNGHEFCERGQVQFRKDGISGIVIFNLSAFMYKNGGLPIAIKLSLLPNISKQKLADMLNFKKNNCKNLQKKDILFGLLKPEMAAFIIKKSKISGLEMPISQIKTEEIDALVNLIKNLEFFSKQSYEDCQVLAGGVDLKNLKDMQASKGLYFCGEATHVFGPCGGYNLQWAFSSGYAVAKLINK